MSRINALISRPQGASLPRIMEGLEVSRATVNRDLQTLRDGMNAPIVYDRARRVYHFGATTTVSGPGTCSPACGYRRRRPTPS